MIDWTDVMKPSPTATDSVIELAGEHGIDVPLLTSTQVASAVSSASVSEAPTVAQSILNADIRELDFTPKLQNVGSTSIDTSFTADVESLLSSWPEFYDQAQRLLTSVYPVLLNGLKRYNVIGGQYGTRGSDVGQHFGQVYGTADNPHALAECIVSGIGNWKMYTAGIKTLSWDTSLVLSSTDATVCTQFQDGTSPVPVGKVLNGQCALLHVFDWDLHLAQNDAYVQWGPWYSSQLKNNAIRIQRGMVTLSTIETTSDGALMIGALNSWGARLMEDAKPWL